MKQKLYFLLVFLCMASLLDGWGGLLRVEAAPLVIVDHYDYKEGLFSIEYPHFDGLVNADAQDRMNQVIERSVCDFVDQTTKLFEENSKFPKAAPFTATMGYTVQLNEGNLLSVTLNSYVFAGGAHGSPFLQGYTFNVNTGERLCFSDLFPFDSASREQLNQKILQQIEERKLIIFTPYKGIKDNPDFYLKEGNLVEIIFQKYEIAAGAAGILRFEIPYQRIEKQALFSLT